MFAEQQLEPDGANSGALSALIRGAVPAAELRQACSVVVERHPALRTVVEPTAAGLVERELPAAERLFWSEELLPCAEGDERRASRAWIAERYANRPWDLTEEYGIRFHLLDHGLCRRTLAVPVHHIAFDGRSKFLFAREFCRVLETLREGREPEEEWVGHPEMEQCADAARSLAEYYSDWSAGARAGAYAVNFPRAATSGAEARTIGHFEFDLASGPVQELREAAHGAGTSFFGGVLAATAALLGRYGNDRMAVSVAVDASTPATADRIGCAVNVVPVVIEIDAGDSLDTLLGKAAEAVARLKRLKGLPFGKVVNDRAGLASVAEALYDFGISYVRLPGETPSVPGLDLEWDFVSPNFGLPFDVSLALRVEGGAAFGRLDYLTSAVDATAAETLVADFEATLEELVSDPAKRIGGGGLRAARLDGSPVSLAGPVERLDEIVERHAASSVALVAAGCSVSYRQLNERADALLAASQETGSADDAALSAPVDAAAATLATLKSGALCVSTGVSPQGLCRAAVWLAERSPAAKGRTLHRAAPGSRTWLAEILSTWAAGGTLVVPQESLPLAEVLAEAQFDRVFLRPHEIGQLIARGGEGNERAPQLALVSVDEVWSAEAVQAARRAGVRIDAYLGCEGAPVALAASTVEEGEEFRFSPRLREVPSGFGLEVVAADGRELPTGLAGRLALHGDGEGLVTDQHVRMSLAGGLEWLGRSAAASPAFSARVADHAASLAADPQVREVEIVIEEGETGEVKLRAFVAAEPDRDEDAQALERRLRHLTSSHHPLSGLTVLDGLPRETDGAVDEQALRVGGVRRRRETVGSERVLETVRSAWGAVFEMSEVSLEEDFFELGGHSLLATRLLARIQDELGVELSLRDLLDYPTVGELAEAAERELGAE
jgi:acyl carrier protein